MTSFEKAYSIATENHGILTASAARGQGITSRDIARWVKLGRLIQFGNGVYKATYYPSSEEDAYAIAVAQCGAGAYLVGESVLGLLRLMPVSVDQIFVRAPRRLRRQLPGNYVISLGMGTYCPININGILCQKPVDAIRECIGTHMAERLLQASKAAYQIGYLDKAELEMLQKEILHG